MNEQWEEIDEEDPDAAVATARSLVVQRGGPRGGSNAPMIVDGEVISGRELSRLMGETNFLPIVQGVSPDVVESWCYAFRQKGETIVGLSVRGIEAAVREMAKNGEIIRVQEPRIVREDADEVLLVCQAGRYAIDAAGNEHLLDFASRALRQAKFQMVQVWEDNPGGRGRRRAKNPDGTDKRVREDDPKWFEKAFSKATRNATLPLIPAAAVSIIKAAFQQTAKFKAIEAGQNYAGYRRDDVSLEGDGEERPQGSTAGPPAPPRLTRRELVDAIRAKVLEAKSTWDDPSFRRLYAELLAAFPKSSKDGKQINNLSALDEEDLEKMRELVIKKTGGEPPPPEEAPVDGSQKAPSVEGEPAAEAPQAPAPSEQTPETGPGAAEEAEEAV